MKKNSSFLCLFSLCLLLGGCNETQHNEEYIELVDPVGFVTEQETVAYRNISLTETYATTVSPYVEEYSFSKAVNGFYINAFPGTEVKKGDVLAGTDSSDIEKRIERIESLLNDELEKAEELKAAYDEGNDPGALDAYLKQKQLYDLDSAYYEKELNGLKAELQKSVIVSGIDGSVASIFLTENTVKAGAAVISVTDVSQKFLKTDLIRPQTINAAKELYALIEGKRFDVIFEHSDAEKSATTFRLSDPEGLVNIGANAVLVLVSASVSHIPSIAQDEIREDASGTYIYVMNGGSSEKRYITTGVTDGVYTEILSGAAVGERISNSVAVDDNGRHASVVTADYVTEFSKNGYFMYPESSSQYAAISNGTVYFTEFTVEQYDIVKAGDVIARIHVTGDDIELERLRLKLQRLKERNASQAEIEKLTQQIAVIERDLACKEIVSEHSGIVATLADIKDGDVLRPGTLLITVADPENCYVAVDAGSKLPYGTEVTLTLSAGNAGTEAKGKVVTLGDIAEAMTLKSDYTLIQLSPDAVAQAMQAVSAAGRRVRIGVKAELVTYKNMVAVPKSAVTIYGGSYFVNLVYADGSVHSATFVSCGRDNDYYYCISGLSEGDEVCLK